MLSTTNDFEVKYSFKPAPLTTFAEANMVVLCGIDTDIILSGELMITSDSICCPNSVVPMSIETFLFHFLDQNYVL